MKKMNTRFCITCLLLLLGSQLVYSRSIVENLNLVSDGGDSEKKPSFLEWGLSASTESCVPIYGFLPCSSNIFGLLFLVVVYEILLSLAGRYVGAGSDLFFRISGPGIFGASLFQLLGTIPQIILVFVNSLAGSAEAATQNARMGMGLVAGSTVMLLTVVWGISVILGSYNLSQAVITDKSGNQQKATPKGYGIVTDVETTYTARIVVITLVPFLFLLLTKAFHSSQGKRAILLTALIITILLLFAYMFCQIFQPWIQDRRFEYLMSKYAKDKLFSLISQNGEPDQQKIEALFERIDKNESASVSAAELRVLLLGVKMNENDLSTDKDVEDILESFDSSGDGQIAKEEFIRGMTQLATDISNKTAISSTKQANNAKNGELEQGLLAKPQIGNVINSWMSYARALSLVVFGTALLLALSQPLANSVIQFSSAANLPSFLVSYLVIPLAMNYGTVLSSITSARQKSQKSISLTLSALYGGVYMNNIVGLISFLATVNARNLSADVFSEVVIVLTICILMALLASFTTKFPRWAGYVALLLYPTSLALIYLFTSVLGWP